MNLLALPAFEDNYIWLLHNGTRAWVVDPGDAQVVRNALKQHALELEGILVTHHHGDHTGGVAALQQLGTIQTWLPATECAHLQGARAVPGSAIEVLDQCFEVLAVPGHTAGHVAYFSPAIPFATGTHPMLLCGDTLFSAGCGRLFEGSASEMYASLQSLAALPDDTLVCAAHEYTLSNLRFAHTVEPHNEDIEQRQIWAQSMRARDLPTLPSTLAVERRINPFLRSHEPAVRQSVGLTHETDSITVWAALRAWKNKFQ